MRKGRESQGSAPTSTSSPPAGRARLSGESGGGQGQRRDYGIAADPWRIGMGVDAALSFNAPFMTPTPRCPTDVVADMRGAIAVCGRSCLAARSF